MATICPRLSARQLKNDCTDGHLYTLDCVQKVLNKYGLNIRVTPQDIRVAPQDIRVAPQHLKEIQVYRKTSLSKNKVVLADL